MAHADTPSLPRLRSREVSMRTFQRVAVATLVILWLVVTTGGLVRLTASGLGCPHWPTCSTTSLVPQDSSHALIEFSNRVISGLAMLAAVAMAVMAYRVPGLDRRIAHAAAIAAAGTVAQVPLGAVTVEFDLNPYLVMSHFLLAMVVVSVSTWATLRALRPGRTAAAPAERRLGLLAWAAVAAYLALITSGAFVTAAGPHPGSTSTPIERLGNFYDAAYVHVRVATAFTVLFLAVAAWLWRTRRGALVQRLSLLGIVLLVCQAAVGEYQYRNGLPWDVIALHVALAATLLITVVTVAGLIWEGDPRTLEGSA
ncbi:MAG TPA: COX15/CtaA family protein [Gaiellales bacterium]|jgi:cytochrome c oxidase assembly protein subunit 15